MPSYRIRAVEADDAEALAPLLDQLGYPAAVEEIRARLAALNGESHVLVAASELGLSGFVAVAITRDFIVGTRAIILGLVVASGSRNEGVGTELLSAAESWAFGHGAAVVAVRSNVIRDRAHRFYERNGYRRVKSQHIFEKRLP